MPKFRVTYREEREILLEKVEIIEAPERADAESLAEFRLNRGEISFGELGGRPVGFPWVDRVEELTDAASSEDDQR